MRHEDPGAWRTNAVYYGLDVETFYDSDGDGYGDLRGALERLDHVAALGVTCIWLLPFYVSPHRDNGYDVVEHRAVDPKMGDSDTFQALVDAAGDRGIRVLVELIAGHTSDEHWWFQSARRDPAFRDRYVFADDPPPPDRRPAPIFPGIEPSTWTYDPLARAHYFHRFYRFQPALDHGHPDVRAELSETLRYWQRYGVAGFRVDSASHLGEHGGARPDADPHDILRELHAAAVAADPGVALLGEADVDLEHLAAFFGEGDEMNLLLNFLLDNYVFLALARGRGAPLADVLRRFPRRPAGCQWLNYLRNLDELDVERLDESERAEVMRAFAPREEMRLYGRGIRRRIAPMLGGDRAWIEMAYSLAFSLPGAPLLVYGDEIGMGDDLRLPERHAVRTPMQWTDGPNAGFSLAPAHALVEPVVAEGPFSYRAVNVASQAGREASFLCWMTRLVAARRACPAIGEADPEVLSPLDERALGLRYRAPEGDLVVLHDLADEPIRVEVPGDDRSFDVVFGDATAPSREGRRIELPPRGYRWLRARR